MLVRLTEDEAEAKATIEDIRNAILDEQEHETVGWDAVLCHPTPGLRLMLIVVIGVATAQQVTGIEACVYATVRGCVRACVCCARARTHALSPSPGRSSRPRRRSTCTLPSPRCHACHRL